MYYYNIIRSVGPSSTDAFYLLGLLATSAADGLVGLRELHSMLCSITGHWHSKHLAPGLMPFHLEI
jgi:hypothetical protein